MRKYFGMLPRLCQTALPRSAIRPPIPNSFGSAAFGPQPPRFGQPFNQNFAGQRFFSSDQNSNNGGGRKDYDALGYLLAKHAQMPRYVKGFILPQYVPMGVAHQIQNIPFNELPEEIKGKFDQRAIDRIILEENKLKEIEAVYALRKTDRALFEKKAREIIKKYTNHSTKY